MNSDTRQGAKPAGAGQVVRGDDTPPARPEKHGTIQSFYRRVPWVSAPADLLERIVTARHWIGLADRIFSWRALSPDSTRLARGAGHVTRPIGRATARLRRSSAGYARLDWAVRKGFWTALWAGTVAYRYRPRKPWYPRREKPIGMVPPTDRHPDFKAHALRFPDSVPLQEASFLSDLWVETLHFFQDIFPIQVSGQARASNDPDARLAACYPRPFRWIRDAPRWHPELAAAAADRNLLGALAVGGPYAKLLEKVDARKGTYTIDLGYMHDYPVRDGLMRLGCRMNFKTDGDRMKVTDIVYDGDSVAPGDARWDQVEEIAMASLVTHLTVWRQGMEYHAGGLASFPAVVHGLPPAHPIRRLLAPHVVDTTSVSYYTHLTLRRTGFDVTGFAFPLETLFKYYDDGAMAFDLSRLDIRLDKKARGIPDTLAYPWYDLAQRYWDIFERFVGAYVEHVYPTEDDLAADDAVHIWYETLDRTIRNGVKGYVPKLDKDGLKRLCTVSIYSLVIAHDENSLWDYALYMPTLVHADGQPMTVGEVQCVSNFQLVICSAVSDLMNDFSYLATDAEGRKLMRELQADLSKLQRDLEADGDRFWHVYPSMLKSSVAC